MQILSTFIEQNLSLILFSLSAIVLILLFFTICMMLSLSRLKRKYKRLTRGIENMNFEAIFTEKLDQMENTVQSAMESQDKIDAIAIQLTSCFQKFGFLRYNPFQQVGGDLSFSLALLDGNENGIVFTNLYSRNGSALFGKPIEGGVCPYPLSEEEKEVLGQACKISKEI